MTRPLDEVERELTEALDKAVARGARVVRADAGNRDGITCGCALQLLSGSTAYVSVAEERFGWTREDTWAFISGFDGCRYPASSDSEVHKALGRRLAAKYVDGRAEGAK